MKYQSELINEILEDRGHKKSSLHYESECVESWIEENKGAYPKLCEYEGEWLNYIVEKPIGNFPYETIIANPTATVSNVVPYEYKSAILKGNTLVNLIQTIDKTMLEQYQDAVNLIHVKPSTKYLLKIKNNTTEAKSFYSSEITEWTQIDIEANQTITKTLTTKSTLGRNTLLQNLKTHTTEHDLSIIFIEYQDGMENWDIPYFEGMKSVQMPVLTTTGKNLFPNIKFIHHKVLKELTGNIENVTTDDWACEDYLNVPQQKTMYTNMLYIGLSWTKICFYDENKTRISHKVNSDTIIFPENAKYWRVSAFVALENSQLLNQIMLCNSLEEARSAYEPFKSNILTVNEDVTLRSNGDICDELNLLTGQLTQRIDEDGEVLTQEVIKTVELTVTNQDGETLSKIKPIEGIMHIESSGTTINPTAVLEIPVEAIMQNLNSFIEEE